MPKNISKGIIKLINKDEEGKIVCLADLLASVYEVGVFKVRYSVCLYLLFVFNIIRY